MASSSSSQPPPLTLSLAFAQLSVMAGIIVVFPSLNANIGTLNLLLSSSSSASTRSRSRRRMAAQRRHDSGSAVEEENGEAQKSTTMRKKNKRTTTTSMAPVQMAVVASTCVSILADACLFYICLRQTLPFFPLRELSRWTFAFNVLKRTHSISSFYVAFLRLQLVTRHIPPSVVLVVVVAVPSLLLLFLSFLPTETLPPTTTSRHQPHTTTTTTTTTTNQPHHQTGPRSSPQPSIRPPRFRLRLLPAPRLPRNR
ncbi:hypothetical protein DFJ73DRAFT_902420, partial [Zopfochytrium polystomum]